MRILRFWRLAIAVLLLGLIAGCSAVPETPHNDAAGLAPAIASLGPGVDPEEARRAAAIAQGYSLQLAQEYQITDPPYVHNYKVQIGRAHV